MANVDSQWMEPHAGEISSVSKQILNKYKHFQMEMWHIYSHSHLNFQCFSIGERKDCQAVGLDS